MYQILSYKKLNSTNKFALENISSLPDNSIISADIQDTGRGRLDRKWVSDKPNNCYISFVLKPDLKFQKNFPNITQYLSIVLCETLEAYGIEPNIKWPNDVLVNNKKIAGILSEMSFSAKGYEGIVLGIGVNLNLSKSDLEDINIPATSLNLETSKNINKELFINSLCDNFYADYDFFLKNGFGKFLVNMMARCVVASAGLSVSFVKVVAEGLFNDFVNSVNKLAAKASIVVSAFSSVGNLLAFVFCDLPDGK